MTHMNVRAQARTTGRISALLLAGIVLAAPAFAQEAKTAEDTEAEARYYAEIQNQMRTLGLDVGNAYACSAEEDQAQFQKDARHLYLHVIADHGADAAYDYAASVGFGAARDAATIDCPVLLEYWDGVKASMGF